MRDKLLQALGQWRWVDGVWRQPQQEAQRELGGRQQKREWKGEQSPATTDDVAVNKKKVTAYGRLMKTRNSWTSATLCTHIRVCICGCVPQAQDRSKGSSTVQLKP